MVAKQFWRILHQPHSTHAQLLKARYFPGGNLTTAIFDFQPSYLWRSILNSRKLILEGMVWNVKARNLLIFERKCLTELEIVQHALRLLHEFQNAAYNRVMRDKPKTHRTSWGPPPAGTYKLNSDAAIFADGTVGFGFVIQDANGLAILSGLTSFQIETNSEILAIAIRGERVHVDYIMMLVEDIRSLVVQANCTVVLFCKRDANNVAHSLAHYGAPIDMEKLWSDDVPASCFRFLINDVRREPINV
ncbi:hypothetical protein ACS0TY_033454 [Phlomoides rotata]